MPACRTLFIACLGFSAVCAIDLRAVLVTRIGVFRNGVSFLEDSDGTNAYDARFDRFIPNFTGPGGYITGDYPVIGDWTGDFRAKVGIYRSTTGTWYLDANDNGILDAGDITYHFGGLTGDVPVVGDWSGLGKSCIGIFRQGFFWILDWNCNGSFEGDVDATFPFGGISGDVPVVGAWTGKASRVGVVRKYAPGGVPQGPPFYWVLDSASVESGPGTVAAHQPSLSGATAPFPFGGDADGLDMFVTGDWLGTGTSHAGVYRRGNWLLDLTGGHTYDTFYQFGGLPSDVPVTGKWACPFAC
jgi:hypothetical protein